ncbi:TetR/AcrR family transcriptional regulator [Pseudonocardia sp. DSM 110487]|uniref:TetR/AcrR family transcriptional regulator n=1 Tax=Pseudonocardia sp. DSM 110487 TaxID=2865833 RepID=UPI001C6A5462|nr:TetR/AcrR family transcriptional regulator [Pseudonocardia sp. DSM 110487]QYN37669.1 TetR/AcrR family transcriptional regulator [Pseudonocardia sp. DSM 110487]
MATPRSAWQTPGRRRRAETKRAAILDAAEELFVSSGYELTSVDAIAARAAVSKRTVYDHFGDKQSLFRSVVERVDDALLATVRTATQQELTDGRDLRDALLAFVQRLTTEAVPSSTYATFRCLNAQAASAPRLPDRSSEEPERILEERFAQLAADGELKVSDPRRAVQHFVALTMRLVIDAIDQDPAGAVSRSEIQEIITDGVDAFLRAYR